MRIGSLFSGIGGLELGLEWAGLGPVEWQVEQDERCRRVLARHWPDARRYDDVRTVGGSTLAPVDVLCGGFPCQDISGANAGGRGLDGARSGLWFEYLRIIGEIRPRVVVVENVARLVRRGLDVVVAGLDDLGFAVEGTRLRASDVGAPHGRERLFLVAYADSGVANTYENGRRAGLVLAGARACGWENRRGEPDHGDSGGPESGVGRHLDGVSVALDVARWPASRGERQHFWEPTRTVRRGAVAQRPAQIRALGNAVVPHCAYVVGMRVRQRLGLVEAP